jgi:hypothetical protein
LGQRACVVTMYSRNFFSKWESSFDPRGMRSNRKRDLPLQLFLLMRRKKLFAREDCRSCTQNLPKFLFVYCELSPTRAEPCWQKKFAALFTEQFGIHKSLSYLVGLRNDNFSADTLLECLHASTLAYWLYWFDTFTTISRQEMTFQRPSGATYQPIVSTKRTLARLLQSSLCIVSCLFKPN